MRKVYQLDPYFEATGEQTVQPVLLWGADGRPLRERFTKTASDASDYIQSVTPQPGKTIVLVLAMGAYETYDLNRNGDGFNEFPYRVGVKPKCGHPECASPEGWIAQEDILPRHYKSFEQYGKNYMHHVNKDPNKSVGDVVKAFWNGYMHRVELLVGIDNSKAPEIVQRIADGEYPAVSMGCRIKYDVCTECGHRAPTRKQYCDHLKFNMRQVLPSGLRAGALNPSPRFFDISWVIKPADQTGYMMKKVAYAYEVRTASDLGAYLDAVDEKRAAIRKIADIDKIVRGLPVDYKSSPLTPVEGSAIQSYVTGEMPNVVSSMPVIDDDTIQDLAQQPFAQVLSTLHAAGVTLTTEEFVKLLLARMAPGVKIPETALNAIVALQGGVFNFMAENPQVLDQMMDTGIFDLNAKNVKPEIAGIAEKYLEKRSTISDYLTRNLIPPSMRSEEPAWTDTLHVRDPQTGELYTTNRAAAVAAHDQVAKRQLAKMLGSAALLAGGYKAVSSGLPRALQPVAAGITALAGSKMLRPDYGPQFMTEEGMPISAMTEMQPEKTSADLGRIALPILGTAGLVTALGHDYESRLRRGLPVHDQGESAIQRVEDRLGQLAYTHPTLSGLGALALYGAAKSAFETKIATLLSDVLCDQDEDVFALPDVDFERAAEKLGSVIMP